MPEIIGSAFVKIAPEPKSISGFGRLVRAELKTSLGTTPIPIRVTPKLAPFRASIQRELSAAKFTVPVTPVIRSPATIRRQLQAQILGASGGLVVPIKALPTGGVAPTAPTAAPLAAAQAELAKTGLSAAEAEAVLNAKLAQGAVLLPQVVTGTEALNTARGRSAGLSNAAAQTDIKAAASARAIASATEASAAAELRLTEISDAGRLKATALSKANAQLAVAKDAASLASDAHTAALLSEDVATIKVTEALVKKTGAAVSSAEASVETAIADRTASAAAKERAASEALLARGIGATGLSALGARGATLAASGEFLIGAAAATAFFKSVQLAAGLEEQLNVFKETAGATADEMERVSEAAKDLGADITLPAVSANDAAEAMTELSKAGLSVDDAIDSARGTLQLATAAQLDNAEAVNITASALNAFGLQGIEAVHVADLLAGAANEAQGGIGEMGGALSSVASVARQAGLSLEDTIALLTLLAKNGIQGQEAGTALRVALIRLIAPTDRAAKVLHNLDVNVLDAQGHVRPEIFGDLGKAVEGLGARQRNMALNTIFGTRAIRTQAVLGREGAEGLNAMREATNQAGLAENLAAARTQGFTGKVEALKSGAETLGESLGELTIGPLGTLITDLSTGAEAATNLTEALKKLAKIDLPDFDFGDFGPFSFDFGGGGTDAGDIFGKAFSIAASKALRAGIFTTLGPIGPILEAKSAIDAIRGSSEKTRFEMGVLKKAFVELGSPLQDDEEFIKRVIATLGRLPTMKEVRVIVNADSAQKGLHQVVEDARDAGTLGADELAKAFERESQAVAGTMTEPLKRGLSDFVQAAGAAGQAAADAVAGTFTATLETQIAVAEAAGDTATQLARLRQQLARARAHERRQQRLFEEAPGPNRDAALRRAAQRVTDLQNQIAGIVSKQESDAREAASKIEKARNEADQRFLDAIGLRRTRLENKVLIAEGTASVADDISTHQKLRQFLVTSRDEARKTLKDAQTRAQTVGELTAAIIREQQTIDQLQRDLVASLGERFEVRLEILRQTGGLVAIRRLFEERIKQLRKALGDARKGSLLALQLKSELLRTQGELNALIQESLELDVQFAQTTENRRLEVRARERLIKELQAEQRRVRRGTLEWKRLRNAIAEQRQAIRDLKGEAEDLFHEMSFEFLTRQQGFAATVMSNLLAPFSVSGAVGGIAGPTTLALPGQSGSAISADVFGGGLGALIQTGLKNRPGRGPGEALGDAAAAAAAGERGGTPAQFATIIRLLTEISHALNAQNQRGRHPEAKHSARHGGASMDTM
jgi:TP901 family phage tail tape measure protein